MHIIACKGFEFIASKTVRGKIPVGAMSVIFRDMQMLLGGNLEYVGEREFIVKDVFARKRSGSRNGSLYTVVLESTDGMYSTELYLIRQNLGTMYHKGNTVLCGVVSSKSKPAVFKVVTGLQGDKAVRMAVTDSRMTIAGIVISVLAVGLSLAYVFFSSNSR